MSTPDNAEHARKSAWSPEARAKRARTIAAKKRAAKKSTSIPLDAIPERPKRKPAAKRAARKVTTNGSGPNPMMHFTIDGEPYAFPARHLRKLYALLVPVFGDE